MNRAKILMQMPGKDWDLLVIGGGISGAGVAREAALRGLSVALVEQGDFAGGTSCRSGKMIIGGLRYLLNREIHLVRKGLKERDRLFDMAPHLVRPAPYLFPVWKNDPDGLWKIRLGLTLYDALGNRRRSDFGHRAFDRATTLELESGLRGDGLCGSAQYWDGMTDDGRLTIETLQAAVLSGAAVANYAQVEAFRKENGRIRRAAVRDLISGSVVEIKAQEILTAAGPWTDFLRQLDEPNAPPLLKLVKGSFIVVPRARLPVTRNVTLRAPDTRMTFAVPLGGQTYIGTTEVDYSGDPAGALASRGEVDYLLAAANRAFPAAGLTEADVLSTWAGVRPLVGARPGQTSSQVTRDYNILKSASGLAILAGGKLTGFRAMGEHVIDELFPATRDKGREASLAALPGASEMPPSTETILCWSQKTAVSNEWLTTKTAPYGCRFESLAAELPLDVKGEKAWLLAQARFAVKHEMAQRLSDVLWRRTGVMMFESGNGLEDAPAIAEAMGALFGWNPQQKAAELKRYQEEVAAMFFWRASV